MSSESSRTDPYSDLVVSRKAWLDNVLRPWCFQAGYKDLLLAEGEWQNLAGKVEPQKTLWYWAWSRFPELVHPDISDINETHALTVELKNGDQYTGFPDARESLHGKLVIQLTEQTDKGMANTQKQFKIDEIHTVQRIAE